MTPLCDTNVLLATDVGEFFASNISVIETKRPSNCTGDDGAPFSLIDVENATLQELNFFSNVGLEVGAMSVKGGFNFSISDFDCRNNVALKSGGDTAGCIFLDVETFDIENSNFIANRAATAGAVRLKKGETGFIRHSRFWHNRARSLRGGAIYATNSASNLTISVCFNVF